MDSRVKKTREAYADSGNDLPYSNRILEWDGVWFSVSEEELYQALDAIGDYNDFSPSIISEIIQWCCPPGTQVKLGRSSSPCLYVYGPHPDRLWELAMMLSPDHYQVQKIVSGPDGEEVKVLYCWWD